MPTPEPTEPTCRACYASTLTPSQRERFYAEAVTSCIHWCLDHQRAMDDALSNMPQVQYIKATMAVFEPPTFAPACPCPATDCERQVACRPPAPSCPHPFYG